MAGLKVVWGFDNNQPAAANWRLNFPEAILHEMDVTDLVRDPTAGTMLKVDVLHLSPPCQFFSPAHTVDGINDKENFAAIFSVGEILDVVRPRVGTLEQTYGILQSDHQPVFKTLVRQFTSRGYSVRWTHALLQRWGLPQQRQRLVLFFAGPNEALPDFPAFTHSAEPGSSLEPFASCEKVISGIRRGHPLHNVDLAIRRTNTPWDGTSIAPRCITTSGGQNYHFSGLRDFTLAEFMALQGFPLNHIFVGAYIKKQIGNAVPPIVAVKWFDALRRSLEKTDGIEPREEIGNNQSQHFEVVELRDTDSDEESPSILDSFGGPNSCMKSPLVSGRVKESSLKQIVNLECTEINKKGRSVDQGKENVVDLVDDDERSSSHARYIVLD